MLKTLSAALVAVSLIAAPAFAGTAKPADVAVKPVQTTTAAQAVPLKANVLNANAKMGRHHVKHRHHRYHRHHKHMSALHGVKTHRAVHAKADIGKTIGKAKLSLKHTTPATRRG